MVFCCNSYSMGFSQQNINLIKNKVMCDTCGCTTCPKCGKVPAEREYEKETPPPQA